MSILILLVPLALILVAGAVFAFVWASGDGQFDDLRTPSVRLLFDEDSHGEATEDDEEPPV